MTPVILIPNTIPTPNEIDNDWLIANDWILRRVLLDKSFLPALNYATTSLVGDELAITFLQENANRQILLVEKLTQQVETKTRLSNEAFAELKRMTSYALSPGDSEKLKDIAMAMGFGPFSLAGGSGDNEAAEKREEIAKLAIERADKDLQEVSAKLSREVTAMQEAVLKLAQATQEYFDKQVAITRLCIHIKDNIFYYMQAIWDYEPTDQRYFRLYNLPVPWIEMEETTMIATGITRQAGRQQRQQTDFARRRFAV
ncbi:MAG: hypothetical protein IPJ82_13175 [Lewinellaceae bacterium]|nr:hypothetical protein [Lewinellaceae bacterium]